MITVNISGFAAAMIQVLPKASDKKAITKQLGAAAMQFWKQQAQQGLRGTSRDYVAGLQHRWYDNNQVTITLSGQLPNMLEQGWPGGDMRDWMLKGPSAKAGKDGRMYTTIPLRHGTPGTSGRNVGAPMPKAIHNVAKALAPTLSRPGGLHGMSGGQHTVYGQKLHPDVRRMGKQAKEILTTKQRPWHSTSIYMGMIRKEHRSPGGAKSSAFTTFRRISLSSSGEGHWIHPGIKARNYAKATQNHIESIAQQIVLGVVGK